ncbi:DTW domain-containing protein [Salinimonas marina]|uniref:tRNA-uridine aminocarboxypropyltransferase n=1 Tax=Salinimonas marina TaxID=2785918 RepID=A0A7S9DX98_9ALTE|nr:DTW domain-containing protein [Salinimonas marina]
MRPYCSTCDFPVSTCVCSAIESISCPVKLIILQHHKEAGHAKNTARLVPLVIPDTLIVAGSQPEDFYPAQQLCEHYQSAVIYPSPGSQPIESPAFTQAPQSNCCFWMAPGARPSDCTNNSPGCIGCPAGILSKPLAQAIVFAIPTSPIVCLPWKRWPTAYRKGISVTVPLVNLATADATILARACESSA